MIAGIVASQIVFSPAAIIPDFVPIGATHHYDFVTGQYFDGTSEITAEEAVSDVSRIDINGLSITDDDPLLLLLGGMRDKILSQDFTLLVVFIPFEDVVPGVGLFSLLTALDDISGIDQIGVGGTIAATEVFAEATDAHNHIDDDPQITRNVFADDIGATDTINKIAISRSTDFLAVAHNGGAMTIDAVNNTDLEIIITDKVEIAWATPSGISGYIHSMTIYPTMPAASLPEITVLPPSDALVGSIAISLAPAAVVIAEATFAGTATLNFALIGFTPNALVGSIDITFAPEATFTVDIELIGIASISFPLSATLIASIVLAGAVSISFPLSATVSIPGGGDIYYSNVVFLSEFEGTDGQTLGITESKNGRAITIGGSTRLESDQKLTGATSLFSGNAGATLADNADWDLSDANSDQFTIEISVYQTVLADNYDILYHFGGAGNWSWLIRINSTQHTFYWSSDGSTLQNFSTSGVVMKPNTWHHICIEKNASGKIRFYFDGVMRGSATPADSTFFNSTFTLGFGAHSSQVGYIDHVRITKGVARYDSDSGYAAPASFEPSIDKARLDQQYLETIHSGSNNLVRLGQQYAEAIHSGSDNKVRLDQQYLEVIHEEQ